MLKQDLVPVIAQYFLNLKTDFQMELHVKEEHHSLCQDFLLLEPAGSAHLGRVLVVLMITDFVLLPNSQIFHNHMEQL